MKLQDVKRITAERNRLLEEVAKLKAEKDVLVAELKAERDLLACANTALTEELDEVKKSMQAINSAVSPYGGYNKIRDKANRVAAVGAAIIAVISVLMSRTHVLTRPQTICEALFEHAIFGIEETQVMLCEMFKRYFFKEQRELFAPWKVLRAIDLSAVGGLNYNGIETLRSIECVEKYQRGILPARTSVQRASCQLHEIGQKLIPFERKQSDFGEMFQYDYEKFLRYILKTFKLDELAQTKTVELSITLDGAELCDGISHLTAGIKITNGRAIDPRSGIPLCTVHHETFGRMFSNQSRNFCFAMKSLIGNDSKKAYKEFSDFFQFFERVKKFGLPASELGPAIMPMDI